MIRRPSTLLVLSVAVLGACTSEAAQQERQEVTTSIPAAILGEARPHRARP